MAGPIDPTARAKYPVILGDGLLGKTPNDIFTGVRYNHKPALSAADAPAHARLKPSMPGKTASYDLAFADASGPYAYAGTRTVDGNQYVLHFDPQRKALVLDKVDSVFNMNLSRTPATSDPDKLARQFPPLAPMDRAARKPHEPRKAGPDAAASQPRPKARPAAAAAGSSSRAAARSPGKRSMPPPPPRRRPDKKESSKPAALLLPRPEPPKPEPPKTEPPKDKKSARRKAEQDDDDDDDDGDGDLLIEYPGRDDAAPRRTDFSPAFPAYRPFDDFMDKRDSEGDADSSGDADTDSRLPPLPAAAAADDDDADAASVNVEDDLEKEMEIAFEDLANSLHGSPQGGGGGDESEISEED